MRLRLPWRRSSSEPDTADDHKSATDGRSQESARPRADWRSVPPLKTVAAGVETRVAKDKEFRTNLGSAWSVKPALSQLGHDVSLSAPAGLLPSLLSPVEGYPDPPELRWASAGAAAANDMVDKLPPVRRQLVQQAEHAVASAVPSGASEAATAVQDGIARVPSTTESLGSPTSWRGLFRTAMAPPQEQTQGAHP